MTERLDNNSMLYKLGPGNNNLTVCFRTYLFLDELTMVIDSAYQDLLQDPHLIMFISSKNIIPYTLLISGSKNLKISSVTCPLWDTLKTLSARYFSQCKVISLFFWKTFCWLDTPEQEKWSQPNVSHFLGNQVFLEIITVKFHLDFTV